MTESELKSAVIDLATMLKWKVHHDRPSQNSRGDWLTAIEGHAGFPDIFLARDGIWLLIELKSEKGVLSDAQTAWAEQLVGGPSVYHVWKPRHWLDGTVEKVLKGSRVVA